MSKQSNNRKKQNNCIQFDGQEIPKRDLQKLLKKMEPDERVYSLSQLRTSQILEKLMSHVEECQEKVEELGPMEMLVEPTEEEQETYLNNKALFDEWNELLDEDGKDTGSNYLGDGVPWWVANFYLKHLYEKKAATSY